MVFGRILSEFSLLIDFYGLRPLLLLLLLWPLIASAQSNKQKPEVFIQLGHSSDVCQLAFSPATRVLASRGGCSYGDSDTKLWDLASGRESRTLTKAHGQIMFSPDGQLLAAGDGIWDAHTWEKIRQLNRNELVLGFSADRTSFISSEQPDRRRRSINIKIVETGHIVRSIPVEYQSAAMAASPDGRLVAVAERTTTPRVSSSKPTISIWDTNTGRERHRLYGHAPLAFSADSNKLAFGTADGIAVWDLSNRREIISLRATLAEPFGSVVFSGDGKKLALDVRRGREKFGVKIWDLVTGYEIRTLEDTGPGIAFAPDGLVLASAGHDGIEFWDLLTGKQPQVLTGNIEKTGSLLRLVSGNRVRTGGYLWDLETGLRSKSLADTEGAASADRMVSPDGKLTARINQEAGTFRLFDNTTDGILWAADRSPGDKLGPVRHFMFRPTFSPNSQILAWMGLDSINLTEARTGRNLTSLPAPAARSASYSPDGRLIATASTSAGDPDYPDTPQYNSLQIWNSISGKEIRRIDGSFRWAEFSPNGRYLVSLMPGGDLSGFGSSIKIWDTNDWSEINTIKTHHAFIEKLVISADGKFVVSFGYEGTIGVWDIVTVRERAQLVSFKDGSSIAITPEGYYVASSEAGEENLNVRVGDRVFGVAAYREKFYRPDLVKLSLAGGLLTQFARLDQVLPAPQVEFGGIEPIFGTTRVKVKLRLRDVGGGLGDVRLFLNGTAVAEHQTSRERGTINPGAAVERVFEVQLGAGSRELSAVAFNTDNTMQSNATFIEVSAPRDAVTRPSLHAVVVGIQEFRNPKFTLGNPVSDAKLFAETISNFSGPLFQNVNIKVLTTPEQTSRDAITEALRVARTTVGPDDLFMFYVASHGLVDEGEYFLITSNVGSVSTERLKVDALSQGELRTLLSNIPATKKLVVIDTCQSGALGNILQSALLTRGLNEEAAMKILSRAVGSTVLSASTSLQDALEGYQGHGLLTFLLAEGLAGGADYDRDGFVSTLEVATYIDKMLPSLAEKAFHHAQYPIVSPSGQGFPLSKVK
jgi:WD40 repeat protein